MAALDCSKGAYILTFTLLLPILGGAAEAENIETAQADDSHHSVEFENLIKAAAGGDVIQVKALLQTKVDVNAKRKDGTTALMLAAIKGHTGVVRALLDAKANVNARASNGATVLIGAAQEGHKAVVQLLLDARADVNAKRDNGATALMQAAEDGHKEVVQILLDAKAEVNAQSKDGQTALMVAAYNGYEEVVQLLLGAKANVNVKADSGATALLAATSNGFREIVQLLLNAKADANAKMKGKTALDIALQNDHESVARILRNKGADQVSVADDGAHSNPTPASAGKVLTVRKGRQAHATCIETRLARLTDGTKRIRCLFRGDLFVSDKGLDVEILVSNGMRLQEIENALISAKIPYKKPSDSSLRAGDFRLYFIDGLLEELEPN